jgi:hypothetical protein
MKILEDFNDDRHVTAGFATNCETFVSKGLRQPRNAAANCIHRNDVDWEGKLIKELLLGPSVRKNVEIRFMFSQTM